MSIAPRWLRRLFDCSAPYLVLWSPALDGLDVDALAATATPRRTSKPRVRILPSGWIRHPGGPFPFDPKAIVEVTFADGHSVEGELADHADFWPDAWWRQEAGTWRRNIIFYRLSPAVKVTALDFPAPRS
jgi:hypothetical protein